MSKKFHITPKGVFPCKAHLTTCKYLHYSNLEEANKAYDEANAEILALESIPSPTRGQIPQDIRYKNKEEPNVVAAKELLGIEVKKEVPLKVPEIPAFDWSKIEKIDLPKEIVLNHVCSYRKRTLVKKAYRGESHKDKSENGGLAIYGRGLYSTTNKEYAATFGKVRAVSESELPSNPLSLKTSNSLSYLEQLICEKYNISKRQLYSERFNVENLIQKLGYDGLTIGEGKEKIIVKY